MDTDSGELEHIYTRDAPGICQSPPLLTPTHLSLSNPPLPFSVSPSGFASLALFNLLRFPLMALPEALTHLFQAHVALARIQRFLQRAEVRAEESSVGNEKSEGEEGRARKEQRGRREGRDNK
jgi:hypothetical protein